MKSSWPPQDLVNPLWGPNGLKTQKHLWGKKKTPLKALERGWETPSLTLLLKTRLFKEEGGGGPF